MKKPVLLIILFILCATCYCQVQLGIKTGFNWYKVVENGRNAQPSNFSYDRNSIPVSIYFCQRNHFINFSVEVEYLNRNYSAHEYWGGLGSGGDAKYSLNSSYLNLIIEPQFTFGGHLKFLVFPGIYCGMPVSSKINGSLYEFSLENYFRTTQIEGSAKGIIPRFDFGALLGIGIEFPVFKNLIMTIQDVFSISIAQNKSKWGEGAYRYFQNKAEVGLAYQFGKTKKAKRTNFS